MKATLLSETRVNEVDLVYYSVSKRQTECLGRRTTGFTRTAQGDGRMEDGVGGRGLASYTRTAQGDGGVEDGVGGWGEDYCCQHSISSEIPDLGDWVRFGLWPPM